MKIYFCGSIRGGRDDVRLYEHIVKTLEKFGKVLTEHVGDSQLSHTGQSSRGERGERAAAISDVGMDGIEEKPKTTSTVPFDLKSKAGIQSRAAKDSEPPFDGLS